MEFPRQEYWNGLPFPPPGNLPDSGIEPTSSALAGRFFIAGTVVKNPPAMWETWVQFLGWEDPLEKEMAIYSSTIAWRIPWTEEPGRLQSMG